MNISNMDDEHLINTIKFFLRKVNLAKSYMRNKNAADPFKSSLNYTKEYNIEELKEMVVGWTNLLSAYIMEAMLRGMDFKNDLQSTYERKGYEPQENLVINTKLIATKEADKMFVEDEINDYCNNDLDNEEGGL